MANKSETLSSCNTKRGLRVGHLNIYHLSNKIADVCALLQNCETVHLLGISKTRLDHRFSDADIEIPNYTIERHDAKLTGETGLAVYIHNSITPYVYRRRDLEPENVESLWLEIKDSKSKPLFVGIAYRNPSITFAWYDEFVNMMDIINRNNESNILLLCDFNLDLFKAQPSWASTISFLGLNQLVTQPTRVTKSTSTLLDHIYTNNSDLVGDIDVPLVSVSDHHPIFCPWSTRLPKSPAKDHTTIRYRSFKHFNRDALFSDLNSAHSGRPSPKLAL